MPAEIIVRPESGTRYEVTVREDSTETRHSVRVDPEYARTLAGGKLPADELLRRSFLFLLEHESKESILREFDLRDIGRYFPEYESIIRRRLAP